MAGSHLQTQPGALALLDHSFSVAREHANKRTPANKNSHIRDISWAKLNKEPLIRYENNWELKALIP